MATLTIENDPHEDCGGDAGRDAGHRHTACDGRRTLESRSRRRRPWRASRLLVKCYYSALTGSMRVLDAIARSLGRDGCPVRMSRYGVPGTAAKADIRPVIVRQRRSGLHLAAAVSRLTEPLRPWVEMPAAGSRKRTAVLVRPQATPVLSPIQPFHVNFMREAQCQSHAEPLTLAQTGWHRRTGRHQRTTRSAARADAASGD